MADSLNPVLDNCERFVRAHLAELSCELIALEPAETDSGKLHELIEMLAPFAGAEARTVADSLVKRAALERASAPGALPQGEAAGNLQSRVRPWVLKTLGPESASDRDERNHRFLEEALELAQSCSCTREEVLQAVEYVYQRPVGETYQEVGGVMITLAALCLARGVDMHAAGEDELARIWTLADSIRIKQEAKPPFDPIARVSLFDEALMIADQAMVELLETEGVAVDGSRSRFAPADESQGEVKTLDLASEAFREAVAWLVKRGLAKVEADVLGDVVVLAPQILAAD
jgi:hypothetical protein